MVAPKLDRCDQPKPHLLDVKLSRKVEVHAYDPQGLQIELQDLGSKRFKANPQTTSFLQTGGSIQGTSDNR